MRFKYNKLKKNGNFYIIAEAGVNHECSIKNAKKLIFLAKKGGADAIKFQTYKADKIVLKNSKAYWDTKKEKIKNQHILFSKYDKFESNDYKKLADYCKKLKIDFMSTPFDEESVEILNNLVSVFKISSSDITNIPLLEKVGNTRKPIILSTGASNIFEINQAVNILNKYTKKITIMHCVLNYPTLYHNANLGMINDLKKKFPNYLIGYSDHTPPDKNMHVLSTAYTLGAKVIEKHFTFNKKKRGNDHYHSMDYLDVKKIKLNLNKINELIGPIGQKKNFLKTEIKSRKFARRCIATKTFIKKGALITKDNIIPLRPNIGIPVENWYKIIGKKVLKNIHPNKAIKFSDIEK